ncbi:MAG: hypothetical protein Q7R49_07020 [Candidatus Daviesbacteria bacterium]|nr:hypothetical protein [Candidatus Daviesbacteria bacterium]
MPKVLNQKGFLQLVPLLLIVGGLITGLYLVQHPTIFRPKASSQNITFSSNTCLTTQQATNTPVLTCNTVQLKFTSPLETGQTSDAGVHFPNISLVKEASAYEPYTYKATTGLFDRDRYRYTCFEGNPYEQYYNFFWAPVGKPIIKVCAPGGTCVANTNGDATASPNGDVACVEKPASTPTGPADRIDGTTPQPFDPSQDRIDDTPLTPADPSENPPAEIAEDPNAACNALIMGFPSETDTSKTVTISNIQNSTITEGQSISGQIKAWHCNNAGSAVCANDISADFNKVLISPTVTFSAPAPGSSSHATISNALVNSLLNRLPISCGRVYIKMGLACGPIGGKVYDLGRNCSTVPPITSTDEVQTTTDQPGTGGATIPSCTKGQTPTTTQSYMTTAQTNCVLNWNKNILPTYINGGWCSDEGNKQGIANDWYAHLASEVEKAQVSSVCLGGSAIVKPTRTTAKYRFAEDLTALKSPNNAWLIYTPGVTVPYIFNTTLGIKHIYAQFMDNNNTVITVGGVDFVHDQIELVNPIPANQGGTPAGAAPAGGATGSSAQCNGVTLASGNGNPGGQTALTLSKTGSPAKAEIWIASNNEVGKGISDVNSSFSWTKVTEVSSPASYLPFTIPTGLATGSHLIMVALYDSSGALLDGNPNGILNPKCASVLNVQAGGSQAPAAPATDTGGGTKNLGYDAKCSSVSLIPGSAGSAAGQVATLNVSYSGKTAYLEVWMAQNSDLNKSAGQVQNWQQVRSPLAANTGTVSFNVPSDATSGNYAVMIALRDNTLSMLDGNPGGTVNPACTTTLPIK